MSYKADRIKARSNPLSGARRGQTIESDAGSAPGTRVVERWCMCISVGAFTNAALFAIATKSKETRIITNSKAIRITQL
jgi:hypothetical protein